MTISDVYTRYQEPVKVGRISYINVAPIYYDFDYGLKPPWLDMLSAPPSVLNHMMSNELLDISPVSSVAYAEHCSEWLLLPDLSVSCMGRVMSVVLASHLPFEMLHNKKVMLTDDSASSAKLIELLFSLNHITPLFKKGTIKTPEDIDEDASAVLVIGDAALNINWSQQYDYVWDLGSMWKQLKDLPFVFSVWAVRKSFAERRPEVVSSVIELFHLSKKKGTKEIERVIVSGVEKLGIDTAVCRKYYKKLCYDFGELQKKGLMNFFDDLFKEHLISKKVRLSFFQNDLYSSLDKKRQASYFKGLI
jgi:chorismate dehydratase